MADLPYDEKNPWGKPSPFSTIVTIGGDNIDYSKMRREAVIAVQQRRATPEQAALVREADEIYRQVLQGTEGEE